MRMVFTFGIIHLLLLSSPVLVLPRPCPTTSLSYHVFVLPRPCPTTSLSNHVFVLPCRCPTMSLSLSMSFSNHVLVLPCRRPAMLLSASSLASFVVPSLTIVILWPCQPLTDALFIALTRVLMKQYVLVLLMDRVVQTCICRWQLASLALFGSRSSDVQNTISAVTTSADRRQLQDSSVRQRHGMTSNCC